MWEFDQPVYFYLLLLLPVVGLFYYWNKQWKKKAIAQFGSGSFLKRLAPTASTGKPLFKMLLFLSACFFAVIALVNPKIGTKLQTVNREGIDIVFAMDVSKSMLAEDIAPNRLEKAKQLAQDVINQLGTDRVGLVAYAGSAFPVMPITSDYSMAKSFIKDLNTDLVSSMGTALNQAIEVSGSYFEDVDSSKVLILISDGEDHSENIQQAIATAKAKGLKIITIGIGTAEGGKIPMKTNGMLTGYKKDMEGNEVVTQLNENTLKEIAEATGGVYIYGGQIKEVLPLVHNALKKIEKKDFEAQQVADFESQFQWFLAIAFLLFLVDAFIKYRKSKWLESLHLFNEK